MNSINEADLLAGRGDWKNIQDVVRNAFTAMYSTISQQQLVIARLESELSQRPTFEEITQLLSSKVSYSDFKKAVETRPTVSEINNLFEQQGSIIDSLRETSTQRHADLLAAIAEKASIDAVNEALAQKANKVAVANALHKKVNKTDFEVKVSEFETSFVNQKEHRQLTEHVYTKFEEILDNSTSLKKEVNRSLDDLETRVNEVSERRYLTRREFDSIRPSLCIKHETKLAVEQSLNELGVKIIDQIEELHESMAKALVKKADVSTLTQRLRDFEVVLSTKAATSDVNNALQAARNELETVTVNVSSELDKLSRDITSFDSKTSIISESIKSDSDKLNRVEEQLSKKSSITEMCNLLDLKANIVDVNKALSDLSEQISTKAPASEVLDAKQQTQQLANSLVHEMCVGRWVWKSGKTKSGHGIPWNVELINTDPEIFKWEKDRVTICTVLPGLYEVTFGFFASRKPTVQLLVNGEPVLSAINSSSYVLHHGSSRLSSSSPIAGNVTGLTCVDFLVLPARARLAISYQGEEGAEGFLGLKKL
ncbi:hypothetical protein RCL1_004344 [Eukaryota sp. TZLM3-RCL]